MESNIKGLVSAGHEMASELKEECGAVDMRSVAKLISDLATQLEVQLVRANALAAENAALKQSEKEFNNFCRQEYYGWEDNFTETPATDAFLAEMIENWTPPDGWCNGNDRDWHEKMKGYICDFLRKCNGFRVM